MQEEGKTLHNLHVLGMSDDLWGRDRRLGSETWKGCQWGIVLVSKIQADFK